MAGVVAFPRAGFIIGAEHCSAPGPEHHMICLAVKGHEGEHQWQSWEGCRVRTPLGLMRFGGFAS